MEIEHSAGEETRQDPQTVETTPQQEDPKEIRYKEQLEGRRLQAQQAEEKAAKIEAMFIKTATDKVEQNNEYLLEIFEEDPALADKVAKQFGERNAKDAIAKIEAAKSGKAFDKKEKPVDPEELYKEFEERMAKKEAVKAAEKAFEGLDKDEKAQAKEMFKELTEGKSLSAAKLEEIAEMAAFYVTKDSVKDSKIAKLASTALGGKGTTSQKATSQKATDSGEELAKAMGLGHLYSKN